MHSRARTLMLMLVALLAMTGCVSTPPAQPPRVVSFSVTPDTALQPSPQATVSWEVEHVDAVTLTIGDGEIVGEFEAVGELTVLASASTTYTLSASNDVGTVTASATLTVQPFGPVTLRRVADGDIRPMGAITVGEPVDLIVRVLIVPPPGVSVTAVTADLGHGSTFQLRDDGSIAGGDDIGGDGVYSGRAIVAFPEVGASDVAVSMAIGSDNYTATTGVVVVQALTGEELADVQAATEAIADHLEQLGPTTGVDDVIDAIEAFTVANLDALGIEFVETHPRYMIRHHDSGLKSVVLFYEQSEGILGSGPPAPAAAAPAIAIEPESGEAPSRVNAPPLVPLDLQTRGTAQVEGAPIDPTPSQGGVIGPATNEIPRSVFIWTPFDTEFASTPWYRGGDCAETAAVVDLLAEAGLGFDVTVRRDTEATVDSLREIADYGYVLLGSHGAGGNLLITGEVPTDDSPHLAEWAAGTVYPCSGVVYTDEGIAVAIEDDRWCVTDDWFAANIEGTMPNSIVFNNSCQSTMSDGFRQTFESLGAKTYLGYDENVACRFARNMAVEFSEKIASGLTSGQAYTPKHDTLLFFGAEWQMLGSSWQRFATGLYNPDFRSGLAGWSTSGDGRAITRLGSGERAQLPVAGDQMAVISSGLGFTTSRGAIQQTFRVPDWATRISFDWNFLSEEFLEFIGSPYQDQFVVSVTTTGGTETVLLDMTIDSVAADFGAQRCQSTQDPCLTERGDLMPGWDIGTGTQYIRFDRGDVWFTGWKRSTRYDISEYAGQVLTLRFFATDVTDQIFDTAILIDRIWIE